MEYGSIRQLVDAHPKLFKGKSPSATSDCPCGWGMIVHRLCTQIEASLDDAELKTFRIMQIKEKFGALRFHCDAKIKEDRYAIVSALISEAEIKSAQTCMACGEAAAPEGQDGWIATLCAACRGKPMEQRFGPEDPPCALKSLVQRSYSMDTILFLDFDGVLHHFNRCQGVLCHLARLEAVLRGFPNVDIVISSAWRTDHTLAQLQNYFSADIRDRIIDVTPCFDDRAPLPCIREKEIEEWLRAHGGLFQRWIALDDSDWFFQEGCPNLILVDAEYGFNDATEIELRRRLAA